jgi:hypothetical protein
MHKGVLSAVKKVEFVSNKMSYIILKDCWCDDIVLNVDALMGNKNGNTKDSFYEELEHVFNQFPKHHMKILL